MNEEYAVDDPGIPVTEPADNTSNDNANVRVTRSGKKTLLDHFPKTSENNASASENSEETSANGSAQKEDSNSCELQKELESLSEEEKKIVHSSGSLVWLYFSKSTTNKEEAICKLCKSVRKTGASGSTKTLSNHLENSHVKEFHKFTKLSTIKKKLLQQTKSKVDPLTESKSQPTLLDLKGSFGSLPAKSPRAKDITKAIAIFLCKGLHAYDTVTEEGFKYLIWKLEPKYNIPHRTTFSRSIIPKLYEEVRSSQMQYLKKVVNTLESITITTDLWSSRAKDPFISCTVQFIESSEDCFELVHLLIDCRPFPHPHSAERICEAAYEMLEDISVDAEKVKVYFVTDNDSKMLLALQQPSAAKSADPSQPDILRSQRPWKHIPCFDHTLQLAISDTRKDIGANTVIEKVSAIVSRYSYSTLAKQNLQKFQKETNTVEHQMVKNVATRWNSEYLMLSRFLEQRAAITLELSDSGEDGLTSQQWKLIEGYVQVLKPIAEYTADLGSTKQPTLSMVNPVLFEIKNTLDEFLRKPSNKGSGIQFARALLNNVKLRFPDCKYKDNDQYVLATLLDPRFKALLMDEEEAQDKLVRAALKKKMEKGGEFVSPLSSPDKTTDGESAPKKSKWSNLGKLTKSKAEQHSDNSDLLSKEVQIYLSLPTIDVETGDAIKWWKTNGHSFPNLLPLASEYLGICATEVPSERVFSDGGNTVGPKRTCLLTEHVREIVFLHGNLKIPKIFKSL